jgi:hypothetical protein
MARETSFVVPVLSLRSASFGTRFDTLWPAYLQMCFLHVPAFSEETGCLQIVVSDKRPKPP